MNQNEKGGPHETPKPKLKLQLNKLGSSAQKLDVI